jgi:hypothetical protein
VQRGEQPGAPRAEDEDVGLEGVQGESHSRESKAINL